MTFSSAVLASVQSCMYTYALPRSPCADHSLARPLSFPVHTCPCRRVVACVRSLTTWAQDALMELRGFWDAARLVGNVVSIMIPSVSVAVGLGTKSSPNND